MKGDSSMKTKKKIATILFLAVIFSCVFSNMIIANAASMIYCPNCGKQIDSKSNYCMYCAYDIKAYQKSLTETQGSSTKKYGEKLKPLNELINGQNSPYIIGISENTFAGLYKKMCVNLDLKKNPVPAPDTEEGNYGGGQYEYVKVLKNDSETYEYIGYVRYANDVNRYLVRCWRGYHKDGALIEMDVYYTLDGKYIGNIQRDRTAGTSTSSHNSPYFIPGEPMNHE